MNRETDSSVELNLDSAFPGGNGIASYRISLDDGPSIVELVAQAHASPRPMWFHMRLRGLDGEPIHLRLANAMQFDGDYRAWAGNTIVFREDNRPWQRTALPFIEFDEAGVERVTFPMALRSDTIEIAWCFPYQPEDWRRTIRDLPDCRPARIGCTAEGHFIERYRLHAPAEKMKRRHIRRTGVYLLARTEPHTTPGSWVLDGLMHAAKQRIIDGEFNPSIDLWIVPFVDLDGVLAGRSGGFHAGTRINETWTNPPGRPETAALMLDLHRFAETVEPALVIDLQCETHARRDTWFHVPGPQDEQYTPARQFVEHFRHVCPRELLTDYFVEAPDRDRPNGPSHRLAEWVGANLRTAAITMRTSFQGTPSLNFEIEHYHRLGEALLDAILGDLEA